MACEIHLNNDSEILIQDDNLGSLRFELATFAGMPGEVYCDASEPILDAPACRKLAEWLNAAAERLEAPDART